MTPRVPADDMDEVWRQTYQRLQSPKNLPPRSPDRCCWCGYPGQGLCEFCGRPTAHDPSNADK